MRVGWQATIADPKTSLGLASVVQLVGDPALRTPTVRVRIASEVRKINGGAEQRSARDPVKVETAGSNPVVTALEAWPRGLRRRPAKSETRHGGSVGSNPTASAHPVAACVVGAPR